MMSQCTRGYYFYWKMHTKWCHDAQADIISTDTCKMHTEWCHNAQGGIIYIDCVMNMHVLT